MIPLLIIGAVLLYLWIRATQERIVDTNAEIKRELGAAYNPDAAGAPWQDASCLVMVALVVAVVLISIIGSAVPLLPR